MELFKSQPTVAEGSALEKVRAHRRRSQQQPVEPNRPTVSIPVPPPFAKEPVRVARPYVYLEPSSNGVGARVVDALYTGASFVSNRIFKGELVTGLISSTARSYNYGQYLTPAQREMRKRGFVLFINAKIAGDLNAFGRDFSSSRMSGADIGKMAAQFDKQFTPKMVGSLGPGIFSYLVGIEFDAVSKKTYQAKKVAPSTTQPVGGMQGGANNAYWGVTQFGKPTYEWIRKLALGWGIDMPANRHEMTFGQMLVIAYAYAVYNQSKLIEYGVPITEETLYVSHNQGVGVWRYKNRKVPYKAWEKQSAKAKLVLLKHGFSRA